MRRATRAPRLNQSRARHKQGFEPMMTLTRDSFGCLCTHRGVEAGRRRSRAADERDAAEARPKDLACSPVGSWDSTGAPRPPAAARTTRRGRRGAQLEYFSCVEKMAWCGGCDGPTRACPGSRSSQLPARTQGASRGTMRYAQKQQGGRWGCKVHTKEIGARGARLSL